MKNAAVVLFLSIVSISLHAQQDSSAKKGTTIIKIGNMAVVSPDTSPNRSAKDTISIGKDTVKVGELIIVGRGVGEIVSKLGRALLNVDLLSMEGGAENKIDLKHLGDSLTRSLTRSKELKDPIAGLRELKTIARDMQQLKKKPKKVSTNWFVFDIGFAGYSDRTNYSSSTAQDFLKNQGAVPASKGDYALNGSRVSNFNLWFFMQRASIIKNVLNLKYGFGLESNNYFFKSGITYVDGLSPYTERALATNVISKNKLVANYLTVPMMLNLNTNPPRGKRAFQLSAGISAGYLYGSRQKQIVNNSKIKEKTDFNLERWKLSYVAELGLGPVKLYGSMAMVPLHQYGLDQRPYTVGLRFSN
jgi:hypothetical protein